TSAGRTRSATGSSRACSSKTWAASSTASRSRKWWIAKRAIEVGRSALEARVDLADVAFEDLLLVRGRQRRRIDVPARVVVVLPGFRVDAAHCADHLGGEQDVVGRNHLQQQVDA